MSLSRFNLSSGMGNPPHRPLQLLYISTAKYGGDWLSVPHTHTCAELFYVIGGQGNFIVGDDSFPVSTGDLVVVNPMVEHTETSFHAQPLEYIVLGVDGLELSHIENNNQQYFISHFDADNTHIQDHLRDMLQEIAVQAPGYETVCQSFLEILIVLLMRNADCSARMVTNTNHTSKDSATVRRYIDGHFKEPITLDQLAELVHINKYHMAHKFTRDYGISPISYLLQLRLQESCSLLRSTNHSMSQIAQIVGFSSPSYFSQIFRKTMGISPSDYRTESLKNK